MKKIIFMLLALVAIVFTGCSQKEPDIRIVEKHKVEFIEPYNVDYGYVSLPTLPDEITMVDTSTALDMLSIYTIKLQSAIEIYEARMDSLREWTEQVKKKQLEITGAESYK